MTFSETQTLKGLLKNRLFAEIPTVLLFVLIVGVKFLFHNEYPIWTLESITFLVVCAVSLSVPAILLSLLRLRWVFYGGLFFLFIDMQTGFTSKSFWNTFYDSNTALNGLINSAPSPISYYPSIQRFLLCMVPFCALFYFLDKRIGNKVLLLFSILFTSVIMQQVISPASIFQSNINKFPAEKVISKPMILYLILDGHIGLAGIPEFDERIKEFKKSLKDELNENKFLVYEKAYSNCA